MKLRFLNPKRDIEGQEGFSVVEYIIALIIVVVAISYCLSLTSRAVQSGRFVQKLPDIDSLAAEKAHSILKNIDTEVSAIPSNSKFIGSIEPDEPVANYFDQLNEKGIVIPIPSGGPITFRFVKGGNIPVIRRQWKIIKDVPNERDITVYVSVSYLGSAGKVIRIAKEVKTEMLFTDEIGNPKGN